MSLRHLFRFSVLLKVEALSVNKFQARRRREGGEKRNGSWEWKWKSLSCVRLFATLQIFIQSMESSRPEYWSGQLFPSPGDLPNPWIEPRSPTLRVDSLPAEPPQGKPKNTGVGSLSLLQRIFLNQESTRGLLHCRWILYQLSYQGSSANFYSSFKTPVNDTVWWKLPWLPRESPDS